MPESWLQKQARLKREKKAAEAKKKAAKRMRDIAEAQRLVHNQRKNQLAQDEVAKKRREREQRRRNQDK